ncbi:hypothetical protein JZ751_001104 [Albula glossodonta]|uniref:Soluble Rieske-type ferredoxin domain-containing protein n=1 Tax=Albula glossodonta TaxID=121402 RepID=A0A8T2PSW1_9TELE|nr:hypothetical protein JZ751_001104 [Albula glossodonta]
MSDEDNFEEIETESKATAFSSEASPSVAGPPSSHFIGKKEEIVHARRITKFVNGRDEFNGRLCIVCPWHKYKITLAEGESLYQSVDPTQKPLKPKWLSKGKKQRVHMVLEVNGDVFVRFDDTPGSVESDYYQTDNFRAILQMKEEKKVQGLVEVLVGQVLLGANRAGGWGVAGVLLAG